MRLTRVLVRRGRVHHSKHGRVHQLGASLHLHQAHSSHAKAHPHTPHSNLEHLKSALKHISIMDVPKPKPKKYVAVKMYRSFLFQDCAHTQRPLRQIQRSVDQMRQVKTWCARFEGPFPLRFCCDHLSRMLWSPSLRFSE